jgi:hypothetical protein
MLCASERKQCRSLALLFIAATYSPFHFETAAALNKLTSLVVILMIALFLID